MVMMMMMMMVIDVLEWQRKGWINPNSNDNRGWFQWYCRYYIGRRCDDDERQIRRWRAFKRHDAQVRIHCQPGGNTQSYASISLITFCL